MMAVNHGPGGGYGGYEQPSLDSGLGMGPGVVMGTGPLPPPPPPQFLPSSFPVPQGSNTFELIPHRVFVGGFPPGTTETELREFFEQFGMVREVKLITTAEGVPRGYGFITYSSEQEASAMRSVPAERLEFKSRRLNIGPAMRRITLGTRPNDLAVANPTFGPLGQPPPAPTPAAPGSFPGYQTALPFNFLPAFAHAPPHGQQTPFPTTVFPAWPQVSIQAASPPTPGYYPPLAGQTSPESGPPQGRYSGRGGFHHHFRGTKQPRFDDRADRKRKAGGGGGGGPAPGASTPSDRGETPLPPLGHPLTPLTPGYVEQTTAATAVTAQAPPHTAATTGNFLHMPLSPGPM